MRLCGPFSPSGELRDPEERMQLDICARERLGPALLAVDDTDGISDLERRLPQRLDGGDRGTAGGDDVLDQADDLALLEDALEPLRRAVPLGLLADDQEREPRGERGRRGERDRTELRPREPCGGRLDLAHGLGERRPERAEDVRLRLEAVLVEVVARAPPGAE